MKKLNFIAALALSVLFVTACGNNNGGSSTSTDSSATMGDSSATIIPPPDNSSATNPSLADTAYSKNNDSTRMKKDSTKH